MQNFLNNRYVLAISSGLFCAIVGFALGFILGGLCCGRDNHSAMWVGGLIVSNLFTAVGTIESLSKTNAGNSHSLLRYCRPESGSSFSPEDN